MLEYLVYSLRMQAWIGAAGGTSDWKSAKHFSRNAAFTLCKRDHDGSFACIPVRIADLEQLDKEAR